MKVKAHFYLVSPTKYELWLDKRQLNVTLCDRDVWCNGKMGLSLFLSKYINKIPHRQRLSPQRIHHISHLRVLRTLITSKWPWSIPMEAPSENLPTQTFLLFKWLRFKWYTPVSTQVFKRQQRTQWRCWPWAVGKIKIKKHPILTNKQSGDGQAGRRSGGQCGEKKGGNDGRGRQTVSLLLNQSPSEDPHLLPFSSTHLHLFYVPASHYLNVCGKKEKQSGLQSESLHFPTLFLIFLINTIQRRRVTWRSVTFMLTRIFEPFSLNCSSLGNQPTGVAAL